MANTFYPRRQEDRVIPSPTRFSAPWLTRIFIGSALLFVFAVQVRPVYDPDVYVHLRDGRFWLDSGLAPGADPFTYTLRGQPTEKVEWLFRIGLYSLWRWGGWPAIVLASALLTTMLAAGLGALLFRRWPNLGAVSALMTLGIFAPGIPSLAPRPQVLTYCFLIANLWLVTTARDLAPTRARQAGLRLALAAFIAVPWANLHPGVVILPVWLAAEWLDAAWDVWVKRRFEGRAWLGLLSILIPVTLAAIALNPLGFGLYSWTLAGAQNPLWIKSVVEWMPPEPAHKPFFFLLLGLAWLAQFATGAKSKPGEVMLLLLLTYASLQSRRHIGLFAILVLPSLAGQMRLGWEARRWGLRPLPLAWRRRWLIAATTLAVVLTVWGPWHGKWLRLGESAEDYPHAAMKWLEREKPVGNLFCPFHWGGFVGWSTQGATQVFLDGRLPLYPTSIYRDYIDLHYGRPGRMSELLRQYQINVLLLSPHTFPAVFTELDQSQDWALVYWDHVAEIFIRRSSAGASLLGREYRYLDPNSLLFFHPSHPEQALAEARRAAAEAPHSYLPRFFIGDLLLRGRDSAAARRELEQVVAAAPAHAPALFDLAVIAWREQAWAEAEQRARQCLQHTAQPALAAQAHLLLAEALSRQGRLPEALRHARQARRLDPQLPGLDEITEKLK